MKYYIIAGERSGDLHGGNLIKALKATDSQAEVRCWGGEEMRNAGGELVVHYREMAYMGFWEVLVHLKAIKKKINFCKEDILSFQPDALILIDYAGFNLRIAKFASQHNIPVHYYISPKIWAWNQKRAYKIKRFVDYMYVILPFEKEFYRKFDFEVDYVGNPLLDAIKAYKPNKDFQYKGQDVIAVLPGSRKQEVRAMMENLQGIAVDFPEEHFVIAGVSNLETELYDGWQQIENVDLIFDQTYDLLSHSKAALVTSGTATLETALFEVPQVVVYKTGKISFAIAKRVVKVEFISLVNLILDKEAVRELIQDEFNPSNLKNEFEKILPGGENTESILKDYKQLKEMLGAENTSQITAELMVNRVQG
ncbi:lipid-A-disaccharide synthase [Marivirga tractuosa]|uniref:Lipid-A-disaccharide synthase n=1 Tax=Marivirga tractuosa (strain ATCC 23168 / DSM 4126 / NBRC 15989 / NCIMB 1408 / VKM B-1430 / H-43) TaxID=643867 RepID=E4TML0_MARTH|nr:lipid-A-disaccharide synthase [Marivirga tractuosa]ADR23444.1 lipid-A-disaccharide synthase [Marivirga tractuosa DSM 4126]BDD15879.1 lipid-A-disaccharide synthase [Marivirga tractuosa]